MTKKLPAYTKAERQIGRSLLKAEHQAISVSKAFINRKRYNRALRILGPGLVTGAADDDPSGIATYSQAGTQFGYGLLWAFPLMFPLLLGVQESCARIGAITGKGLAAVIKAHYNKKILYACVLLVVVANTINIGANLGAMASATQLFVGVPYSFLAIIYAILIVALVIFVQYKTYAKILKWLALALLAYPLTVFLVGLDIREVVSSTFTLSPQLNSETLFIFVGMLGTTISPYLFFWDTSEQVEEEIAKHNMAKIGNVPSATKRYLRKVRIDNFVGMALASLTAWFIVIACASTLHKSGITTITTAADAAQALEPLVQGFPDAGLVAKLIFSVGIVGLGLLSVPVLAGSSSYALSELMGWKEGLYRKYKGAKGFYGIIIVATGLGLLLNFLGIDPIRALIYTAVFNAIASVPLLFMIARIGNNSEIMGDYKNGALSNIAVRGAFVVISVSVLFLLYYLIR